MNRMLKGFRQTRREEQFRVRIVYYADDFVILSRGQAKEALEWTGRVLARMELTLNEKETSIRNARQERSDFLRYTFGPHISPRVGRRYLGYGLSPKSVSRINQKVGNSWIAGTGHPGRKSVKSCIASYIASYKVGGSASASGAPARHFEPVDEHVYDRVRNFLRRRRQVSSQGTRQFPAERVYGPLGVFRLQGPRVART